mgnify:CR=1 FL=1
MNQMLSNAARQLKYFFIPALIALAMAFSPPAAAEEKPLEKSD